MQEIKYIIVLIVSTFYFEWKAGDLIIVKIMPARLAKIVARLDKRQARLLAEQASSYRSISAHGITMHFAPKKSRFANEL